MKIKKGDAYLGDCLEIMDSLIEQGIQVDAIITDPPYGTTACKRDTIIPFDLMREQLKRIIKPNGAIILFGSEPFSSALRMSNIKMYKYDWIWKKQQGTNPLLSKKQPMRILENIIVFYNKQTIYNPQMTKGKPYKGFKGEKNIGIASGGANSRHRENIEGTRYPINVLEFNTDRNGLHPTQKPVALIEYLVKTYTNEGETVLDFTAGSFTTAIACENTNRKRICIEKDEGYYNIGIERVNGDTK